MPRLPKLVAAKPRSNKAQRLKAFRLAHGRTRRQCDKLARLAANEKPREPFWWVAAGQNWHKVRSQPAGARECARRRKQMGVA